MILLNKPYSLYERQLVLERRRQERARVICWAIYCATCLMAGMVLGYILRHP